MAKEVDIVALGELLIDFTEAGKSDSGKKLFEQNPGGAPANLLTLASRMGYSPYLPYCTVSPIQDQGSLCSQATPGISLQIHCQMSSIATSASSSFRSSCLSFSYSFTVMFFTPALFRESHAL